MKVWMAPAGLHIEPAQPGDEKDLAKLHAEGFFRGWTVADFQSYVRDTQTPIYVACDAKHRIAGFAMLRITGDECELMTIVVSKKFKGKRLSTALMQAMIEDLMMSPVTKMFLEVDEDNQPARKLYNRFGFTQIGERRGYYPRPDGKTATALVMKADLG
jgi:ribosomal-protein-alanine N-acetyltransferase